MIKEFYVLLVVDRDDYDVYRMKAFESRQEAEEEAINWKAEFIEDEVDLDDYTDGRFVDTELMDAEDIEEMYDELDENGYDMDYIYIKTVDVKPAGRSKTCWVCTYIDHNGKESEVKVWAYEVGEVEEEFKKRMGSSTKMTGYGRLHPEKLPV